MTNKPAAGVTQIPLTPEVAAIFESLGIKLSTDKDSKGEIAVVALNKPCGCCAFIRIGDTFETVMAELEEENKKAALLAALVGEVGIMPPSSSKVN